MNITTAKLIDLETGGRLAVDTAKELIAEATRGRVPIPDKTDVMLVRMTRILAETMVARDGDCNLMAYAFKELEDGTFDMIVTVLRGNNPLVAAAADLEAANVMLTHTGAARDNLKRIVDEVAAAVAHEKGRSLVDSVKAFVLRVGNDIAGTVDSPFVAGYVERAFARKGD